MGTHFPQAAEDAGSDGSSEVFVGGGGGAILPFWIAVGLSVLVFAVALAIVYLFIFNRKTRQSLHDLVVGSYVVKAKDEGMAPAAGLIWRGHYAVMTGIVLLATATNLQEGKAITEAGIDAIVAQGYEAGGHRGVFDPDAPDEGLGTMALTRLLVNRLGIPVIAAGGIMDGAGVAAALALGAVAAQLGTAFVACPESLADAGYRAALLGPAAEHTVMTAAISGRPARCLANRFTALGAGVERGAVPDYPIAYDAAKALHAAAKAAGEFGYGAQWAGQGAPLARAMPAAELVARLRSEMEQAWADRLPG